MEMRNVWLASDVKRKSKLGLPEPDFLTLKTQNKLKRNVRQTFRILHPNHVTAGATTAGNVNNMAGLFRIVLK